MTFRPVRYCGCPPISPQHMQSHLTAMLTVQARGIKSNSTHAYKLRSPLLPAHLTQPLTESGLAGTVGGSGNASAERWPLTKCEQVNILDFIPQR